MLVILLGGSVALEAKSTPFSRIIVFGDSLSDTGNFYRLNGGVVPPAPYAEGRFCNGPLWVEYLAGDLGMRLLPEDNYAVGGATTGRDNSNDGFLGLQYPGLQDQVAAYLAADPPGEVDANALYILWAGSNDFFALLKAGADPATLIRGGVANTVQAIQLLWHAGARHILVANVPDLGLTPFGLSSGMSAGITRLCNAYNQALADALQALAAAGVSTIRVDAFATLQRMVYFPADFGFTNVTEPFLETGDDPVRFLFWDAVHPTTRGHQIVAEEARNSLIDHYSPRRGKGAPTALVHSLNGLVRTGKGN